MTGHGVSRAICVLAAVTSVSAQANEVRYHCGDGVSLSATFTGGASGGGSASLAFPSGAALTLPQAPSADGGRYANGGTEFWIKERSATLTQNGRATTCKTNQP